MTMVQFFVRLISGQTIVLVAHPTETICSVLDKTLSRSGMPMIMTNYTMCLVYRGKKLQLEQTLEECGVDKDAELTLVAQMERSSHSRPWHLIHNDLVPFLLTLCNKNSVPSLFNKPLSGRPFFNVRNKLLDFLCMWTEANHAESLLEIFTSSSAPQALVTAYISPPRHLHRNLIAYDAIGTLVRYIKDKYTVIPDSARPHCILIVLEFCKSLGMSVGSCDPLYGSCRACLRVMVLGGEEDDLRKGLLGLQKIFPFAQELAIKICRDCMFSSLEEEPPFFTMTYVRKESLFSGPSSDDITDFDALLDILKREIEGDPTFSCQIKVPFNDQLSRLPACHKMKINYFRGVFFDLLDNFDTALTVTEEHMDLRYLMILKLLNVFSKLYDGCKEIFQDTMKRRKKEICYLIVKYVRRNSDIEWIFDFKELMEFEARRHFALMMLPELNNTVEPFHMIIHRPHLLAQSFECIAHAHPDSLSAGLFMKFKNEKATGPGVLREWFVLVCEEIFNPQNALFVACPKDRRRFLPNPASKVNPGHLQYFRFCGRVIALALMHRIHVGFVLDRAFVLQLAGHSILLDDIRDADPYLYNSCKQILDMDAEVVDQDALGLTFVHEIDEFGKRKKVELCAGGKSMVVNSKNRTQYVESLIQQCFVTSIGQQVEHFATGFADIVSPDLQKMFFKCLDLEDLDLMLHGSENLISVDDWKAHTDYHGFTSTCSQISWFWKTVGQMSQEQKKVLLFFWTSIKYLPVEGFGGLASRLHIHKTDEPPGRLPTSHTCFYQLCFPSYPSLSVTHARLGIITQEHVGCSFGTS